MLERPLGRGLLGRLLAAAGPFADPLGRFVKEHPTVQMLALSFLLLIGFTLVGEALEMHVSKGYIYFAMGFSVFVEMLNLGLSKRGRPVHLTDG